MKKWPLLKNPTTNLNRRSCVMFKAISGHKLGGVCIAMFVFMVAGCDKKSTSATTGTVAVTKEAVPATISASAMADATKIFASRCTPCHGASGKGDGAASAGLSPKPRDLSSAAWQKATTDESIEKIILYGGLAIGKSAAMPPNPDLGSKPEVIRALRAFIRNIGK